MSLHWLDNMIGTGFLADKYRHQGTSLHHRCFENLLWSSIALDRSLSWSSCAAFGIPMLPFSFLDVRVDEETKIIGKNLGSAGCINGVKA